MWEAFGIYKAGFLPVTGGWLEQAATYCDGMKIIGSLVGMYEEIEMEKAKRG